MKVYDYLIIGSGIAGLNSALTAANLGTVLVLTKKKAVKTSTNWAQGGIAGVISPSDSAAKHIEDTMKAGSYHNKKSAVEYLAKHSKQAIEKLRAYGVPFETNADHTLKLTREGGHQERRIAYVGDYTGKSIEHVLLNQIKNTPQITLWENCPAIKLLVKHNKCYGVQIIRNGKIENVFSYHTILATGGLGQIYSHTTNPSISTGDGIALAQQVGAKLKDLEFIQFHPTAFNQKNGTKFLLSEALRGEGAILKNDKKEAFMQEYSPLKELAPRDIVARSIFAEQNKGEVYLDITHLPAAETKRRFPQIYSKLKKHGFDLTKDMIPITPAAHYLCGGIDVDFNGKTSIENLFAYGEVARTGIHGANRLASNSLLEAMVFSNNISTVKPQKTFLNIPNFEKETLLSPIAHRSKLKKIRDACKNLLWQHVGIIRRRKDLKEAIPKLYALLKEVEAIHGTNAYLAETNNLLISGISVSEAALKNETSLGCHYWAEANF